MTTSRFAPIALIGIDYIHDIAGVEGKIATSYDQAKERNVIAHFNTALDYATEHNWLKILIKVGFDKNYAWQPRHSPVFGRAHEFEALQLNGPGTDYLPGLCTELTDITIIKPRVSGFYGTPLQAILSAQHIETVILAGISTAMTITSTAREAHDRDYTVYVLEDASAAANIQDHDDSIRLLSRVAHIITTDQLATVT